jgi:hypothetical protein
VAENQSSASSHHPFNHDNEKKALPTFLWTDTTLSFASALAMIHHDPRSLILHGIYDRIYSPGTISRRPSLPSPYFARVGTQPRDAARLAERAAQSIREFGFLRSRSEPRVIAIFPVTLAHPSDATKHTAHTTMILIPMVWSS